MTAGPLLATENVSRILAGAVPVTLVRDINLVVPEGQLIAITGPSGSGKSSLLYLLGLLDRPTEGRVLVDGEDTTGLDSEDLARLRLERIGFVFQFHFLLPEFTVLENVTIPMRRLGALSVRNQRQRGMEILNSLDIADQAQKRPDQLSGGQRQRVAVARALANDPAIVLADEPTGSLDSRNSQAVFDILRTLVRDQGRTVVAVTHDLDLAATTDRMLRLEDGRIVGDDSPTPLAA